MKIIANLFPLLLVALILWAVAMFSSGCGTPKLGRVVAHETICDDNCHNDMLDICDDKYEIVRINAVSDKNKILFYCP